MGQLQGIARVEEWMMNQIRAEVVVMTQTGAEVMVMMMTFFQATQDLEKLISRAHMSLPCPKPA